MNKVHLLLALAAIFMVTSCNDSPYEGPETCVEITLEADWWTAVNEFASKKKSEAWKNCGEEISQNREPDVDFIEKLEAAWKIHGGGEPLVNVFQEYMQSNGAASTATDEQVLAKLRRDLAALLQDARQVLKQRAEDANADIVIKGPALGPIVVTITSSMPSNVTRALVRTTADFRMYETYNNREIGEALTNIDAYWKAQLYPSEPEYYPGDYGLYNMAGSVAEWSPDSFDESAYEFVHDLDSSYTYEDTALANWGKLNPPAFELDPNLTTEEQKKQHPLFSIFHLATFEDYNYDKTVWEIGCRLGACLWEDTAEVNKLLTDPEIWEQYADKGRDLKLLWAATPELREENGRYENYLSLYAVKMPRSQADKSISSQDITDASQDFNEDNGGLEVRIEMRDEGAERWRQMTSDNISKAIVMVVDDAVYSAPIVQSEIAGGKTVISFGGSPDEDAVSKAYILAKMLTVGQLPVPLWIIDERLVY